MIYYYFPTKDDLFLAVVEEVYAGLLADLEAALAPDAPVDERHARALRRLGALSDEPEVVRLVVREALISSTRLDRLIERFLRGHIPLVLDLVREGVTTGVFRGDVPVGLLLAAVGGAGRTRPAAARRDGRSLAAGADPARGRARRGAGRSPAPRRGATGARFKGQGPNQTDLAQLGDAGAVAALARRTGSPARDVGESSRWARTRLRSAPVPWP